MNLFKVKDETHIRAIEAIAGGMLGYLVTTTSKDAARVLERAGESNGRINVFPNEQMIPNIIDENLGDALHDEFGNDAVIGSDAVQFDKALSNTMEYIFGGTVICHDAEIAKAITFSKKY